MTQREYATKTDSLRHLLMLLLKLSIMDEDMIPTFDRRVEYISRMARDRWIKGGKSRN